MGDLAPGRQVASVGSHRSREIDLQVEWGDRGPGRGEGGEGAVDGIARQVGDGAAVEAPLNRAAHPLGGGHGPRRPPRIDSGRPDAEEAADWWRRQLAAAALLQHLEARHPVPGLLGQDLSLHRAQVGVRGRPLGFDGVRGLGERLIHHLLWGFHARLDDAAGAAQRDDISIGVGDRAFRHRQGPAGVNQPAGAGNWPVVGRHRSKEGHRYLRGGVGRGRRQRNLHGAAQRPVSEQRQGSPRDHAVGWEQPSRCRHREDRAIGTDVRKCQAAEVVHRRRQHTAVKEPPQQVEAAGGDELARVDVEAARGLLLDRRSQLLHRGEDTAPRRRSCRRRQVDWRVRQRRRLTTRGAFILVRIRDEIFGGAR